MTVRLLGWGLLTALALNAAVYGAMLLGAEPIAAAFNREGNGVLQQLASQGLRLYFLGCIPAGVSIVASAWLAAVGRGGASGLLSLLRGFLVVLPLVVLPLLVLLSRRWGVTGLWLAVPVTEALVCAAALVLTRRAAHGIIAERKDGEPL